MDEVKKAFLRRIALSNSIQAAVSRAGIYCCKPNDDRKIAFREDFAHCLASTSVQYHKCVKGETHLNNIVRIANKLSQIHGSILTGGRFRIGVAQKALNLYLKFSWLFGWTSEPPHCPFDRNILSKLDQREFNQRNCRNWTQMDCSNCYRLWVKEARKVARNKKQSLGRWELSVWN